LEFLAKAIRQEQEIKGIQIGKGKVKLLFLFVDDMMLYLRDPKNSTKKLRNYKLFWQSSRIQINVQKSVAFLYTNNAQTEKEIRETIPFIIASKRIKYLRINLTKETKELFNENHKPLKREIKEDRRWKDLPCSWISKNGNTTKSKISTCSMQSLSKFQ
jgi:hypothetical protein